MKDFLSPFVRKIQSLFFPPPPIKDTLPKTYQDLLISLGSKAHTTKNCTFFMHYKKPKHKTIIEEIKRYRNKHMFDLCGQRIAEYLLSHKEITKHTKISLVGIPQTNSRIKSRGYNVTKTLIQSIITHTPPDQFFDASDLLKHNRSTPQTSQKNRQQRIRGAQGMFSYDNKKESRTKLSCILIDDVCTTGASLIEAERILTENNHKVLKKLTLAHS